MRTSIVIYVITGSRRLLRRKVRADLHPLMIGSHIDSVPEGRSHDFTITSGRCNPLMT